MCSVPMKLCLRLRASSCASTTTWRARSVNRSYMPSRLPAAATAYKQAQLSRRFGGLIEQLRRSCMVAVGALSLRGRDRSGYPGGRPPIETFSQLAWLLQRAAVRSEVMDHLVMAREFVPPVLSDGRVVLRGWRQEDASALRPACGDQQICRFTTVPRRYSIEDARDWIARQQADARVTRLRSCWQSFRCQVTDLSGWSVCSGSTNRA